MSAIAAAPAGDDIGSATGGGGERSTVPVSPAKFVGELTPTVYEGIPGSSTVIDITPSLGIVEGGMTIVW